MAKRTKKTERTDNGYEQMSILDLLHLAGVNVDSMSVGDIDSAIESLRNIREQKEQEGREKWIDNENDRFETVDDPDPSDTFETADDPDSSDMPETADGSDSSDMFDLSDDSDSSDSLELSLDWDSLNETDTFDEDDIGLNTAEIAEQHIESIPDAFIKCLNRKACVDIGYIAELSGKKPKEVIEVLGTAIYQNPNKWERHYDQGWETADEYLSGNIRRKLDEAVAANDRNNGYFVRNIQALKEILPPTVCAEDIYVTLGSPWVPTEIISDFIQYLTRARYMGDFIIHDELTGTWEIDTRHGYFRHMIPYDVRERFGTSKRDFIDILMRTLNMQSVAVYDHVKSGGGFSPLSGGSGSYTGSGPYGGRFANTGSNSRNSNSRFGAKNMKSIFATPANISNNSAVYTGTGTGKGKSGKTTKSSLNNEETMLAIEKQKALIEEFQSWVWKSPERKKKLEKIYSEKFGSIKQRHYDGSFLELPGLNWKVTLYPHQKDAVARIIFSPNTLLAHDVGSGKTFIMIAAGMEMKRLGMSKKNLYVVPNNIIAQWCKIFYALYPKADILYINPKEFTPSSQDRILRDIKNGDYDAVIMAYSSFTKIPISKRCKVEMLREEASLIRKAQYENKGTKKLEKQLEKINDEIREAAGLEKKDKETKKAEKHNKAWDKPLQREIERLERDLIETAIDAEEGIFFDQLGITRLFVDEAHNFKNVPIDTKTENVMGINKTGSKKCKDMMDKVHIVQKLNGGKGVIFATGTPITNSITDAFIMQSYLQGGELALLGLQSFDSWVGMFAEKSSNFEIDVDTSQYRMATRFAQFHNIPELTGMLAGIADFHQVDENDGVPEHDGYTDVLVHKTSEFRDYLHEISERAEMVRHGQVDRKTDNMLMITTDGRKAALDMRLVRPDTRFNVASKVFECATRVSDIYKRTSLERSTQLVFCDTSIPKQGFNIYDEMRSLLVKMGVADSEIAYIHDATTDSKREKLFENMRQGVIRVLIGSTFKLGLGVNVQNKLIAMHHLDVPWRPADMVQREGRILRQGNENKKVEIYRYITEGSFDAYSWQLLETKQRFITDILSGITEERSGADVDDTVLDYAEVKALAIGNPLIKKRVEVANELTKYLMLQRKAESQAQKHEKDLVEATSRLDRINELLPRVKEDADYYKTVTLSYSKEELKDIRELLYSSAYRKEIGDDDELLIQYKGFDIVIPANSYTLNPYVDIRRTAVYHARIVNLELRALENVDKCLGGLDERYDKLVGDKKEMLEKILYIKKEMKEGRNFKEEIEAKRTELEEIDRELGVKK